MVSRWPVLDNVLNLCFAERAVRTLGSAPLADPIMTARHQDVVTVGRHGADHAQLVVVWLLGNREVLDLVLDL